MEELTVVEFLKNIILFASICGILTGLDLLSGAKITSNLKKILDNITFNLDKIIIRTSSLFRKTLDTGINLDEKIIRTKRRIILGSLFITLSVFMILLVIKG